MRKHKADYFIVLTTLALMAAGLVMMFMIGPQRANFLNSALGYEKYSENFFFSRQLISVGVSIVAFIVAAKLPIKILHKYAKWILFLALGLNALLAILAAINSPLAVCQLGGCRWIGTAGVSFQPAELLKVALVIYLADLMARRKEEGKLESFADFWWPYILVCGASLFFVVVLQKDLGTGVALVAIMLATLFISGVPLRYFAAAVGVVLAAGIMSIVISPHRMERLSTFNGAGDSDSSYHIDNALLAIGTGGLLGVGVGNSVQATGYLPESVNDSIFAMIGEAFGFLGTTILMLAFMFLLMRLLKMIPLLDTEKGIMVAGIFAWIFAQVIVNVAAMTGLVPLTGITLPLLSYGGTSMMFVAFALGSALQISSFTARRSASSEDALLLRRTFSTSRSGAPSSSHSIHAEKLRGGER